MTEPHGLGGSALAYQRGGVGCIIEQTQDQTILDKTETFLPWTYAPHDSGGFFTGPGLKKINIPVTGIYLVGIHVKMNTIPNSVADWEFGFRRNGGTYIARPHRRVASGNPSPSESTGDEVCEAFASRLKQDDYIEVSIYQNTTVNWIMKAYAGRSLQVWLFLMSQQSYNSAETGYA